MGIFTACEYRANVVLEIGLLDRLRWPAMVAVEVDKFVVSGGDAVLILPRSRVSGSKKRSRQLRQKGANELTSSAAADSSSS